MLFKVHGTVVTPFGKVHISEEFETENDPEEELRRRFINGITVASDGKTTELSWNNKPFAIITGKEDREKIIERIKKESLFDVIIEEL